MLGSPDGSADASVGMDKLAARLKELSLDAMHVKDSRKIEDILSSLDYPQRSARYEAIPEAHAETFGWALRRPLSWIGETRGTSVMDSNQGKLLKWLETGTGIFWVSGKPGSGKSTFMKYVADHPATAQALRTWAATTGKSVVILTHYFWSAGSQIQKSQHGLWRSLLLGLLRQASGLMPEVCEELWNKLDDVDRQSHDWSLGQLRKSLECFSKLSPTGHRFCIFIDGLDEFDGDHSDMVETLLRLSQSSHLKLCIASRPWNVFEIGFGGEDRHKIYIQDLTHQDIVKFTRSRLEWRSRNSWAHSVTAEERERLITTVTDRAQGVFLWVFLVTKYLREGLDNGDTFGNLQAMLQAFHPELEPFFKQMLDSVTLFYHCQMAGLLRLSLVAQRPLNFMVFYFHDKEHDDGNIVARTPVSHLHEDIAADLRRRMVMRLNGLCKGLLEIDKHDEVQFIHRTVRDWLMSGPMEIYLKHKTRADWDGTVSLLHCHLGWYKCPRSQDEISEPLLSAFSYGNLICEYNETKGTSITNGILDEFLSVTAELDSLDFDLPNSNNSRPQGSGKTIILTAFKARLFESGLWDYLSMKMDEEPRFLNVLATLPLPMDIDPDSCLDPWSDREASVRSKVVTSFMASLLSQNTIGPTIDPVRSILAMEYSQAETVSMVTRNLSSMGAELPPSYALAGLLSHGLPGLLIRLFLVEYDNSDLSGWKSYLMTKLKPGWDSWGYLCKEVTNLRDRPETDSMTQAADFLRFIISQWWQITNPWDIPGPGSHWLDLELAVRRGFPDRCESTRNSLSLLIKKISLAAATMDANRPHDETRVISDSESDSEEEKPGQSTRKRAATEDNAMDTSRKRSRELSLSHNLRTDSNFTLQGYVQRIWS